MVHTANSKVASQSTTIQTVCGATWMRTSLLLMGLSLCVSTFFLTGCASNSATPDASGKGARTDIITDSDEPETRRRARIRMELASGYFSEGKTTVALDELKQALAIDPTFPDAYSLRGLIYMRLNDMRLAEDSFRRALALNPRDANAAHNFGWMLCQQNRYPESFTAFNQALATPLYGEQAKTYMTLGLCQQAAGQKPEAERSLVRSYEIDPANPITGYNLAKPKMIRSVYKLGREQFMPFIVTVVSVLFTDLLIGVGIGVAYAASCSWRRRRAFSRGPCCG